MMMQKYTAFVSNYGTIGARGQDFLKKNGTDIHVCTFCQLLRHNSSCKMITAGGREMRILLNDFTTELDMTSVNVPFIMCGELFV